MKFYSVEWWDPNIGPQRAHFATKRDALEISRRIDSDITIEVNAHELPSKRADVLLALDHACALGSEGPTWYPGKTTLIMTRPATKKRDHGNED